MSESRAARATIVDVAQMAGVAISSASAALNDRPGVSPQTRARVREVAARLRYVPSARARSLSSKRAFSIGLILERDFSVLEADPFFSAFIGGVEESLAPAGYALLLQIVGDESASLDRHVELVESRRVDGVILNELRTHDARIAAFAERETGVVGINAAPGFPFPAVRQDNTGAIAHLVTALAALGHARVAHVSGPDTSVHGRQRASAWSAAVRAAGLRAGPVLEGDFTHEAGVRAADALLGPASGERPTAVFCANDLMAIGFMNRAAELGVRVPHDVSVAGFDGISLGAYVRPTLTTIATGPHALGREAARMLLESIAGTPQRDVEIEPAQFIPRKSIGSAHR